MEAIRNPYKSQASRDFANALRRASLRQITSSILHQCNDLVPTNVVLDQLDLDKRKDRGIQMVPLHQIVGSTGRYQDFDLKFLPHHRGSEERWENIAGAQYQGRQLPPILLYKVSQSFFVVDGNHRVSVARAAGDERIQAHVIEFDASNLEPNSSCQRLGFTLESPHNP